MSGVREGFNNTFGSLKNAYVENFRRTWSPFERSENGSLVKDIFTNSNNIEKLGLRVAKIAAAILVVFCLAALIAAPFFITPLAVSIPIIATCFTFQGIGIFFMFKPDTVRNLVEKVANQCKKK